MFKSDRDIYHIARGVIDCTLPKAEWTHAAHVAAAVWLIRSSDHNAEADMPGLIRAYNLSCGVWNTDTDGYHETITLASIRAADAVLKKVSGDLSLHEAVNAVLMSGYGKSGWILEYWSKPVLFSVEARRNWVPPDLKKPDFM
ncbi:MAG: hypothetical protein CMK09_05265 [Ponticaulis sp.]|nr:hypothetical protein [Ponticaulis sp.]|tara:strand:- start:24209 stop:24637 length:429 start_codon:yes stop_codon:yes gene_type:complete